MKVLAQTAALQDALSLAGSIVATRTPKPVLQCIKLVAENDVLTLMATDLEVGCRYQVTAVQIEEPGEALVPADRLTGIVRESGDETQLTLETEKETCHVRGARTHFKVYGYDPGEYPAVADFTEDGDFQIAAPRLNEMIGKTLFAAAKTHSHYAMAGVLWEAEGKKLQLVATDGHRLAQCRGQLNAGGEGTRCIVPAKLMGLIQRIAGDGEETLDVKVQNNQILIRTARAVLVGSLVQGNFPKYADVIPKETSRKAAVNTNELEHRLRQAALLTNEESRGVKLSFGAEEVTLSSRAPETGEATVTCPLTLEGEPIEAAFNPQFLLDVLRVIDSDELSFELNSPSKPAMLRSGSEFLYVLMPVDLG